MPQVTLSPETFRKLLKVCEEKLQDCDAVVCGFIDAHATKQVVSNAFSNGVAPDLTGTTLKDAEIAGKPLKKVDWNAFMHEAISHATAKLGSSDGLKDLLIVKHTEGKQEGYPYFIPDANLSIAGTNTNTAWKAIYRIAKALDLPVKARFTWGPQSSNPGAYETLTINM